MSRNPSGERDGSGRVRRPGVVWKVLVAVLSVVGASLVSTAPSYAATTYFVSTTGNDLNNCLTQGAACATVQHAVDLASCGDTITVLSGSYFQRTRVTDSCTAGTRMTIQGSGTWASKIEGTDATSGWTVATGQCGSSCYRIANPGYVPFALTVMSQRLGVWRLSDPVMGGTVCFACLGTGFSTLARSATNTVNRGYGTVEFWDGIEALWGEEAGFTYLRFRNGEDPDTMNVRVAPGGATNSGTFTLDGADYITIKNLEIGGGRNGVHLINGASNNLIDNNFIRNGERGVNVEGGTANIIRDSVLDQRTPGATAGYAAQTYLPVNWENSTYERQVGSNLYFTNKMDVGNTTEGQDRIQVRGSASNTDIDGNTISNIGVGIALRVQSNTLVHNNTIHHCAAECIWFHDQNQASISQSIYENTIYEGDHLIRIQQMESMSGAATSYIYRNHFYMEGLSGKHIHFNFLTQGSNSPAKIWIYQNTFAGSGWAMDLGQDSGFVNTIPCVRAVNNLVSVAGGAGLRGVSSASLHARIGVYAYNWAGETSSGAPSDGFSGSGCTKGVSNNLSGTSAIWSTPPMPNFVPPGGHAVIDSGIRLDQGFTINAVNYSALPGMTSGYYGDALPDRGEVQDAGGGGGGALLSNLVVNDTANAADWSLRTNIQSGDLVYGDRTSTWTSVPALVDGEEWVRTANDSKAYTGDPVATFKVNANATVYIGHNDAITTKPAWMSTWTDTGQNLTNTDGNTMSLFSKSFSSGATVQLGPNGHTSFAMYTVIVDAT